MWCFIKKTRMPSDGRQKLIKAGIGFSPYTFLLAGKAQSGIALPEEQLGLALQALELSQQNPDSRPVADRRGIRYIVTKAVSDQPEPIEFIAAVRQKRQIKKVLLRYQEELGLNYIIQQFEGQPSENVKRPGYLSLAIWSYPSKLSLGTSSGDAFHPSALRVTPIPSSYHVIYRGDKQVMALYRSQKDSSTLWITYDLLSTREVTEVLDFIFQQLIAHLKKQPVTTWEEFTQTAERRGYINLGRSRLQQEQRRSETAFVGTESKLEKAQAKFIKALRTMEAAERRQRELANGEGAEASRYLESLGREYDLLVNAPNIASFTINDDHLRVKTVPLQAKSGRFTYKMGPYDIEVNIETGGIKITGAHPHVRYGNPCLGNIRTPVAKLVAARQFGVLIPMLIRYLESYNASDAYYRIGEQHERVK
jgi:hypothetical protein